MTRILTTLHLSDIQKQVLAKVKASPNPQIAWEEISSAANDVDENYAAARDILADLGLLQVGEGTIDLTDKGLQSLKDANLVDDMGELTDEGTKLAAVGNEDDEAQRPAYDIDAMGAVDDTDGVDDMGMPPMESLIRSAHNTLRESVKVGMFTQEEYQLLANAASGNGDAVIAIEENRELMQKLYEYVVTRMPEEMPYGTQKARDGDPDQWIVDHIEEIYYNMERSGDYKKLVRSSLDPFI